MKKGRLYSICAKALATLLLFNTLIGCKPEVKIETMKQNEPDYFLLRPELEKMYGYTQAVRVGNIVKIGGVMSLNSKGEPIDKQDYLKQMQNCYVSLEKVLKHYGCTFDDVILENIFTTSMAELQKNGPYRHNIYKNHFPTGSWIGVKELGLPGMNIEIEIQALVPEKSK